MDCRPCQSWKEADHCATAHLAAAAFWGEKPVEGPLDAMPRVFLGEMQMVYFLLRRDSNDQPAVFTGRAAWPISTTGR